MEWDNEEMVICNLKIAVTGRLKSPTTRLFVQKLQAKNKERSKAPNNWKFVSGLGW